MKILDVGGAERGYMKATHVIDIQDLKSDDNRIGLKKDICDTPWPYADKEFDLVYCSNTLEDIKDPIRVCKEMERIGKSGIIIVPSPYYECRFNVDGWPGKDRYAGFCHHRWIVFPGEDEIALLFMHKTSMVTGLDFTKNLTEAEKKRTYITLKWTDTLPVKELIYSDWNVQYAMLSKFFHCDPQVEWKMNYEKVR